MLNQRKGITIAFNWVFAIVAGSVIFLFFGYFAYQNTDLFGKVTAVQISEDLSVTFSNLKTSLISTEISFDRDVKLGFICENGFEYMRVNKGGKFLYDNIVFAPKKLDSSEFLLFTKSWNVPYRVDNFIFMTDKVRKYKLRGSDIPNLDFPDEFREFVEPLIGDPIAKIINFKKSGGCTADLDSSSDDDIVNICYQGDGEEMHGTIYGKDGDNWEVDFYGEAMIYAAIFGDQLGCLEPLLDEKLQIMSNVYTEKIQDLTGGSCVYDEIEDQIVRLNKLSNTNFENSASIVKRENKKRIINGCKPVF